MKRNNLLTGFLMAVVLWGMSACTSTGPLTKCPDMKPQQEKQQAAFKFKKKKEKPTVVCQKTVRTNATDNPTTQSVVLLRQKKLTEITNNLRPKALANTAQSIPISTYNLSMEIPTSLEEKTSQTGIIAANTSKTKQIVKAKKKAIRQAIKARKNVIRQTIKQRKNAKSTAFTKYLGMSEAGLMLIIIAILLPPLAMFIYDEGFSNRFWLSLILTCFGYLPGQVYTLVVILSD